MSIQIKVSQKIYLKDPDSSELGRTIFLSSIPLIDEIGLEQFTFKKLADHIKSPEASIYRYFKNKHKLLIYLVSWYWNWMEHRLSFGVHNIEDPIEQLKIAIRIFTHTEHSIPNFTEVDTKALYRIVVNESPKAYLTKEVDLDNREGYFLSYKSFSRKVSKIIHIINPEYKYATSLVSTAIEGAHNQRFFSLHLPSLTEVADGNMEDVAEFLSDMILKVVLADA